MKRSIGVLTVLVIAALAIIMAPVLQGCQTQTPMLDGAGNVVRDAEGNPILISTPDVAGTTAAIQLALTSFEQGMTIWDRYHPQATPEERAAEQARNDSRRAELQQLLRDLIAGRTSPQAAQSKAAKVTSKVTSPALK